MVDPNVEATLNRSLDALDEAHNYRDWIFSLARPHLEGPVLEVGAGTGTFTGLLAGVGSVTAVEPADTLAGSLKEHYADDRRVELVHGVVDALPVEERFASAVMLNVLEHIEEDTGALVEIRRRLLPGGTLVIWVPAFQVLYSRFDEMLGHQRRYRLAPLRSLVEHSGYTVLDARYVNVVGWFAWLVVARLLGRIPVSSDSISIYDRFVVPVVRAVERSVRPPFGQSVLVVARKPLGGA